MANGVVFIKRASLVYCVLVVFFAFSLTPTFSEEHKSLTAAQEDLVLKDDGVCTRCHDEEWSPGVITIGKTKHGTRADPRTPTCITCHGASEAHLAGEQPKPDLYFTTGTATPASVRSQTCLGCHEGAARMFWANSTHSAMDVSCDSCHEIHNDGQDKVLWRKLQATVCFECHKRKRVQFHKPSRHPIIEGKVVCSDCHNPHGSAGPNMMVRDTVNDTCYKCHAEKRGPFLWEHQPVTEDCSVCHDPHGTIVVSMLKWRVPFLCQQCHEVTSPGTHQGVIPGFSAVGGSFSPRNVTLARGCLNCHTNIHGSNNPLDASAARSFRK